MFIDSPGGSPYCAMSLMSIIMLRGLKVTGIVTGDEHAALWPFAACCAVGDSLTACYRFIPCIQYATERGTQQQDERADCAIYTTNLDEYYMVRVAGLRDQIDAGVENPARTGVRPSQTIALIRERVLELGRRLTDCFEGELRPALAEHDIQRRRRATSSTTSAAQSSPGTFRRRSSRR